MSPTVGARRTARRDRRVPTRTAAAPRLDTVRLKTVDLHAHADGVGGLVRGECEATRRAWRCTWTRGRCAWGPRAGEHGLRYSGLAASTVMLLTPNVLVAPCAESEMNWYWALSHVSRRSSPTSRIALR